MWSVRNPVGRLVEAQLNPRPGSADVAEFAAAVGEIVAAAERPVLGITDMSRVRVFAPEDTEFLLSTMRRDNARVERAAIIINGDALLGMQVERLLREAKSPSRRAFCFAALAVDWLAECMTQDEARRARAFVSESYRRNSTPVRKPGRRSDASHLAHRPSLPVAAR